MGELSVCNGHLTTGHNSWARRRPAGISERSSLCREEPAGRWRAQGNSRASGTLACPGDCCAIMRRPDLFVGRLKAEVLILLITLLIVLSIFFPHHSNQRMISENREEENDHEEART